MGKPARHTPMEVVEAHQAKKAEMRLANKRIPKIATMAAYFHHKFELAAEMHAHHVGVIRGMLRPYLVLDENGDPVVEADGYPLYDLQGMPPNEKNVLIKMFDSIERQATKQIGSDDAAKEAQSLAELFREHKEVIDRTASSE